MDAKCIDLHSIAEPRLDKLIEALRAVAPGEHAGAFVHGDVARKLADDLEALVALVERVAEGLPELRIAGVSWAWADEHNAALAALATEARRLLRREPGGLGLGDPRVAFGAAVMQWQQEHENCATHNRPVWTAGHLRCDGCGATRELPAPVTPSPGAGGEG